MTILFFLDSDDTLVPDAIRRLLELQAIKPESFVMALLNRPSVFSSVPDNDEYEVVLTRTVLEHIGLRHFEEQSACGKLYNTELIKRNGLYFDEEIHNGEDGLFVFKYIILFNEVIFYHLRLYNCIGHDNSSTRSAYSPRFMTAIHAVEKMMQNCPNDAHLRHILNAYRAYRANEILIKIYEDNYWIYLCDIISAQRVLRRGMVDLLAFGPISPKNKLFSLVWGLCPPKLLGIIVKMRRRMQLVRRVVPQ